jgi:hypothetical protein
MTLLLLLLFAHALADYPLQGDFLAQYKNPWPPIRVAGIVPKNEIWPWCMGAHCVKHNDLTAGVADVSAALLNVTRWIEVKEKGEWPARAKTLVHWDHYTELQALFLRRRGGFLFIRIARDYLLLESDAAWALWEQGGATRERLCAWAVARWERSVEWWELKGAIWG